MKRMKRVLSQAKLRTTATSSQMNVDTTTSSIAIGRRPDAKSSAYGFLGKVNEQCNGANVLDFSVWLDLEYPHVIGVFGSRGSGKSFDLGVVSECVSGVTSVVNGQPPEASVLILDVQNQFWTLGLEPDIQLAEDAGHLSDLGTWGLTASQISEVRVWLPACSELAGPSFSQFRLGSDQMSADDWLSSLELERFTPMGQALLKLIEHFPNSLPAELEARTVRGSILQNFQDSTIDALRWRLSGLAKTEMIGNPGLSIDTLCSKGTVSVLLLRDLSDSMRQLVAAVVIRLISNRFGKFQQEIRLARRFDHTPPTGDLPRRVWLVVDEAHVLVPSGSQTAATEPIIDYVKRGRDAGLSLIFATQQPSAVDSRLMSQVDLTLTHMLGFEVDITAAIQRMPTRTSLSYRQAGLELPSLGDAIRTLDPGDCIVADGSSGRAFVMRVRPRLTAHGGNHPE